MINIEEIVKSQFFRFNVIPAKAGIHSKFKGFWMPDQVRHDGRWTFYGTVNIRRHKITGQPVFITAVRHRRIPYLRNLVSQVAPQALPDGRKYPI